ncbi:hypothetical protein ACO0QE_003331 [Hanseniaspora vineae]
MELRDNKVQELSYNLADYDKRLRSSDLCVNTFCSFAQELVGMDHEEKLVSGTPIKAYSFLDSNDFPVYSEFERVVSMRKNCLETESQIFQYRKPTLLQKQNCSNIKPFNIDEKNDSRKQIKFESIFYKLTNSLCQIERYEDEDYDDVVGMIVDLMHVINHLENIEGDLYALRCFVKLSDTEGTKMSKTQKEITKCLLEKLIETLSQKYCLTNFSRFRFFKHYGDRIKYLTAIRAKFVYQKIPKFFYIKERRKSWMPFYDGAPKEFENPDFYITLQEKNDAKSKAVVEYLCTSVEKYEYLYVLANGLFMKIIQIVTQIYQIYFSIAATEGDSYASLNKIVKSVIDMIFQLIRISASLQHDRLLLSLQEFYKTMLDTIKNKKLHDCFLMCSNAQIWKYLDLVQAADKSFNSDHYFLSNNKWSSSSQSILLVKELQKINENSKKISKSNYGDSNGLNSESLAIYSNDSVQGSNSILGVGKTKEFFTNAVKRSDPKETISKTSDAGLLDDKGDIDCCEETNEAAMYCRNLSLTLSKTNCGSKRVFHSTKSNFTQLGKLHSMMHHIRSFSTAPKQAEGQGLYGSTEILNKELCSDNIPSVPLVSEVLKYEKKDTDATESPIIVLHGLFGSKQSNRTMSRFLVSGLRRNVYSLDLRNHGESPHIARHDYPAMANDVEKWVTERNFAHKPILVGHSMGAKVAMSCVLRKPNMFAAFCAIDNAPATTMPTPKFPKYVKQLLAIVRNPECTSNKQALETLGQVEQNLMIRQFLMTTLTKHKDEQTGKPRYREKIPLEILNDAIVKGNIANWEFNSWVHKWSGPALFIRGTESTFCSDDFITDVARFFTNFEIRDIEGTHYVNTEKPKECAEAITDFIERVEDK